MARASFRVRRATKRDLPGILKLARQWCREDGERLPKQISPVVAKSCFGRAKTSTMLVAEDSDGLIGYAYLFPTHEISRGRPDLMLQDLYVTKKKRSLGVGDKMMSAIAKLAKQEDASAVYWMIRKKNKRAQKFYTLQGAITVNVGVLNLKGKALSAKAKQFDKI